MFHFNVDVAIECIKSISDNTQCVTCDKSIGPCVRFPCGHSVCKACAQGAGECLFCISSPATYVIDEPQSVRLKNSAALLTEFQDTFKIDVNKRQRISDHQRVEKAVFPECIQAPNKYCNKRKSLNTSFKNKENISPKYFSGEGTKSSNTVIMKKSAQYVQNWLNQHEDMPQNLPRRPFGDINVNTQSLIPKTKKSVVKLKNVTAAQAYAKKSTNRIRSHLKTIDKSPSMLNNVIKTKQENKNLQSQVQIKKEKSLVDNQIQHICDKNESGIVIDDEPIVIEEDIGTNIVDKDDQAWLAVLEAAKKDEYENKERGKNNLHCEIETNDDNLLNVDKIVDSTLLENGNNTENIDSNIHKKVLFFKKSAIYEKCKLCNHCFKPKINSNSNINNSNDVSIVINNSAFITTIKFTKCENKNTFIDKSSVAIQTDKDMPLHRKEIIIVDGKITPQKRTSTLDTDSVPNKMLKPNGISQSLDVFGTEKEAKQDSSNSSSKVHKCLIIEDSDSDSSISCDNTHEVIVDVHRPSVPESVDCGILRTLSTMEYKHKKNRQVRNQTPNSSNSSDKENLDPNRKKAMKLGKKHKKKNRK